MVRSAYEDLIYMNRFLLSVIGLWPIDILNTHWYSCYGFLIGISTITCFLVIPQTTKFVLEMSDFDTAIEILVRVDLLWMLAILKICVIYYHKKDLQNLLKNISNDWKNIKNKDQKGIMENIKLSNVTQFLYNFTAVATVLVYNVYRFPIIVAQFKENTLSDEKPMFLLSKFFFKVDNNMLCIFLWICQYASSVFAIISLLSFDGLFIIFVSYISAELQQLEYHVNNIIFQTKIGKQTFVQLLKSIVERHIYLKKFLIGVENNFNQVYLVQMICYSITICLNLYKLLNDFNTNSPNKVDSIIFFFIFVLWNVISLFILCLISEKLQNESSNIFFTIYSINWYELKYTESKMLLNILSNTQYPFQLTAGKFCTISYQFFITVLRTSFGYLSMLLAIQNSNQLMKS